jgi:hypothetical protein
VGNEGASCRCLFAVAAGRRQQRYRLLDRQTPDGIFGERGAARRARRGSLARSGSQLVEAAAAQEVPVATLEHVVGRSVQTYGAEQVIWNVRVGVLVLAPPGYGGGRRGGGAHVTMDGQKGQRGEVAGGTKEVCAPVRSGGGRLTVEGRKGFIFAWKFKKNKKSKSQKRKKTFIFPAGWPHSATKTTCCCFISAVRSHAATDPPHYGRVSRCTTSERALELGLLLSWLSSLPPLHY